ncbi:Metallo-hydrolase/oxidoreductase [Neocallimastix lanati (nom. inval.)]|jgi:L-ascorbate metabolism protein UlaG (beta-lactamase superfamily)|uniref:Metallo-hydrolase/oxidoreductase n=1 Tax=Neocallimastix californiae TaxID=1754190 RepID=A0A1Y2CC72_9FUNG|nr:Metallo-hydrolase/oxidoreductase [Neocallimastix sp. JGI-2020a]ORY44632.1 Metallo-hydrolase/oxidoreductase [Neocallimastix californiae]|eukprot:ORY44632.1 Metallo-hydrolase/oxidoreductase [Neocallimastix californiae]
MNVIRRLPEREKSPEKCCASKKVKGKYIDPWPSHRYRDGKYIKNTLKTIKVMAYSFVSQEKNKQLKVDINFEAIKNYYEENNKNDIQLTWLGHAAFLLQINGFTILLDPLLHKRASPLKFVGPYRCKERGFKSFADLPAIDLIIITHNHYDHLDRPTIKEIFREKKNKKCQILCPIGIKKWFRRKLLRIPSKQIIEADWWDDLEFAHLPENTNLNDKELVVNAFEEAKQKITISCVPCQHNSGRSIFDQNKTLWCGWVLKSHEHSLYYAGDTGYRSTPNKVPEENIEKYPYCPAFKQIGNIHGPFDLACIPVGPVYPASIISPDHANANDAVNIHIDCKSKHSIAMHWGTVEYLGLDNIKYGPKELREELKKKSIPYEQFHDVYIGEMVYLEKKEEN